MHNLIMENIIIILNLLSSFINPHLDLYTIDASINAVSISPEETIIISQENLKKIYNKNRAFSEKYTLKSKGKNLKTDVINKTLTALRCARKYNIEHNEIITIIDYSLPSNQKRLWVFNLASGKLLYNTYVGHGITSGTLLTKYFSNKNNSKATSIGVYLTGNSYYGREGLSLRLRGIDNRFNDNADSRYIVMHGGWYMSDNFIQKYGRSGRSWGCPALPIPLTQSIINTIKERSFLVMYYPSDNWFKNSKFLNCTKDKKREKANSQSLEPKDVTVIPREYVLFASIAKNHAIIVINADDYKNIFAKTPPLARMLRRRVENQEYIAISNKELEQLILTSEDKSKFTLIKFVIPVIKNNRGYFQTEMHLVKHDKIENITMHEKQNPSQNQGQNQYTIHFSSGNKINLAATNQFIRWVGL